MDGQWNGMRFTPDGHRFQQIIRLEVGESVEQATPTLFPAVQNFGPAVERVNELIVAISPRFLTVRG